jgi:lipopolysaccharide/colanic/teichoic acid biosynthesis glycosyltransferase
MGMLRGNSLHISSTPRFVREPVQDRVKGTIDVIGASLLIVLLAPVFIAIAAMIWVANGRPIIYRRRVVGRCGEFDAFKFRTMRPDADVVLEADKDLRRTFHESYKLKSDPRVTKLGAVLRKFSLDELPQLFNVLVGQMSLVGPRMITAPELEKYGEHQVLLLTVKPGLTGHWQVYGRQEVSYAERVQMDIEYIRNRSLKTDVKLLMLTPLRVVRGKGAY